MKHQIHVVAAVIRKDQMVLMTSRPENKPPAGWEFPGGKIEHGESLSHAVIRELKEELDLDVTPADEIFQVKTNKIVLHFVRAAINGNSVPHPQENQQYKWIKLTPTPPDGILDNDIKFWKFLTSSLK